MGIGVARKVKIVVVGQTEGVDGPDVTADETTQAVDKLYSLTSSPVDPMMYIFNPSGLKNKS